MNITSSQQPRFRCRVARIARAFMEGADEGHVSGCADCQAYYCAAEMLEQELRCGASSLRESAPEPTSELAHSIMRAVREESRESRPMRFRVPVWTLSAMAAAAIVAVVAVQWPVAPSGSTVVTADETEVIVQALETLSVKLTDTVIPTTGEVLANNPLQKELGSVYSDARSALDFLVLNFLPTAPRPAPATPTGTI